MSDESWIMKLNELRAEWSLALHVDVLIDAVAVESCGPLVHQRIPVCRHQRGAINREETASRNREKGRQNERIQEWKKEEQEEEEEEEEQ